MNKPLSISLDTRNVTTAIPLIADGASVTFRLTALEEHQPEGKAPQLKFIYELVNPAPSTDGSLINPGALGSKFFEYVPFEAKPDAKDPQWHLKKIATRIDALLGTADQGHASKPARPELNGDTVAVLLGKTMIAKMGVRTGEYTGNEIKSVMFPGDIKA